MIANARALSILDQAATIHHWTCDSLGRAVEDQPIEIDPDRTDDAVIRYGLAARSIYGDLKRVIAQAGGLLILAQASARRDAFDLPSLAHAEELCRGACDRLAALSAPGRLDAHLGRLRQSADLSTSCLAAIRATRVDASREPELATASTLLSKAYALLQSTSESRFGMMMVDFRHACCNCGASRQ